MACSMTTAILLSGLNAVRKYSNRVADRAWVAAKVDTAGATRTLNLESVEINSTFDSADKKSPRKIA